jgi:hypothetical protein
VAIVALPPTLKKQQLKLKSEKLNLQHRIADSRDKLKIINEQLKALQPKAPRQE